MDQDNINFFYRGPSIDVSYQASIYLAKRCQSRMLFLEIDQSDARNA
jgi:hypothetical protein